MASTLENIHRRRLLRKSSRKKPKTKCRKTNSTRMVSDLQSSRALLVRVTKNSRPVSSRIAWNTSLICWKRCSWVRRKLDQVRIQETLSPLSLSRGSSAWPATELSTIGRKNNSYSSQFLSPLRPRKALQSTSMHACKLTSLMELVKRWTVPADKRQTNLRERGSSPTPRRFLSSLRELYTMSGFQRSWKSNSKWTETECITSKKMRGNNCELQPGEEGIP